MNFWQWFQQNGDKIFTFVTLASVALKGVDGLSEAADQSILIAGILATAAHQAFFPSQPPSVQVNLPTVFPQQPVGPAKDP